MFLLRGITQRLSCQTEALTNIELFPIMPLTDISLSTRSLVSDAEVAAFPVDYCIGLHRFPDQQEKASPFPIP